MTTVSFEEREQQRSANRDASSGSTSAGHQSGKPWARVASRSGDLLFVVPSLVLVIGVMLAPMIYVAYRSLYAWQPGGDSPFVGFDNFKTLLTNPVFQQVLRNQAFFLLTVPIGTLVPLLLAFLLYRHVAFVGIFRAIFFFPSIVSAAVLGVVFDALLGPEGSANGLMRALHFNFFVRNWLSDPETVKPTLVIMFVWATCGTGVLVLGSALAGVPTERFEAAEMDGASWFQSFWHIMLPSIAGTVRLWVGYQILSVLTWTFTWVYVLTSGGPGHRSSTIDYDIYDNAFYNNFFGVAAAECVVLLVIVLLVLGLTAGIGRLWARRGGGDASEPSPRGVSTELGIE